MLSNVVFNRRNNIYNMWIAQSSQDFKINSVDMNESLFNFLAVFSIIIGLFGLANGLIGFFYQYRLIFYLTRKGGDRVRKISRVYNPLNSINFMIYIFNKEDSDDAIINNYKMKLRRCFLLFIGSIIIFGVMLMLSNLG